MNVTHLEDIRERYFSKEIRWQSWLEVEANLALAQGELNIIPAEAAQTIARNANLEALDKEVLQSEIKQTMAPVFALTKVLAEASGEAGGFVHWGATTQNVTDTGRQLVLKRFHNELTQHLAMVLKRLAKLADKHAELTMVGRTNRQNALPITLGFKIASWIDELLRVSEQLKEVEPRIFQLRFGGAIGGYHSLGSDGPKLARILADRLGLSLSLVPGRTANDPYVEYLCKLSMIGLACGRIAAEFYLLMQEEIGELRENLSPSVVGSSTMPHKSNPKMVIDLLARANLLRGKAASALSGTLSSHEADAVTNRELLYLLEETCPLALHVLELMQVTLENIVVCEERVKANYHKTQALMATEALMMRLARKVGRGKAHDLVHHLVEEAQRTGAPLDHLIHKDDRLASYVSQSDWREVLVASEPTGFCVAIAREAAATGRNVAAQLLER